MSGSQEAILTVQELGGPLGRVASTRLANRSGLPLDEIRLALATDLFEAAGKARGHIEAGKVEDATNALEAGVWMSAWERTVGAASEALLGRLTQQFRDAAQISRMPAPMLKRCLPTEAERLAISAHLGKGTVRLEQALESLDATVTAMVGRPDPGEVVRTNWNEALDLAARRMEAAWLDLEEAALGEQQRWAGEIENVRRWRRPRWPMWVVTFTLLGAAVYLGLVFGGFLESPAILRPLAEFFWERL